MPGEALNLPFIGLIYIICLYSGRCASVPPFYTTSPFFKTGSINFAFTSGQPTQNGTITYSSAIANSNLKIPTLGIADVNLVIASARVYLQMEVVQFTATMMNFQVTVTTISYLSVLKMTFMALDNSFTPPFSTHFFFPNINQNSSFIMGVYCINFTQSTGVTLNTTNKNVFLPFIHFIDCTTYDNAINIDMQFTVINASHYIIAITSSSTMNLKKAGFSRLIFDITAIKALGNVQFSYGIISSANNTSVLIATISPDIIPSNLFYGITSFTIVNNLFCLNYTSSYVVQSGTISFFFQASYQSSTFEYSQIKFSYIHHKIINCPSNYPYYNSSEQLCYNVCNVGWYVSSPTQTCQKCLYDCYTCTNGTTCSTCNATVHFRTMSNNSRCISLFGYYESNNITTIACICSSPCASCIINATNCVSCILGYYMDLNGCQLCSLFIPHCLNCNSNTFCIQCINGSSGSSCTPCNSNQYLQASNNTCVDCSAVIQNCMACSSATSCTYCQSTFIMFNSTKCICSPTYYASIAGGTTTCFSCLGVMPYCQICSGTNICSSCLPTFTLVNVSNCICNSTSFANNTSMQCEQCGSVIPYCINCYYTWCYACSTTFILNSSGLCDCSSGFYLDKDSSSSTCVSCSQVIANCLICLSKFLCQNCLSGFQVNAVSGLCEAIANCLVGNCYSCVIYNSTICYTCDSGYSLANQSKNCNINCGDNNTYYTEQCDDGNLNNNDGCSSTCQIESNFACYAQYVNVTKTFSVCYYTGNITFHLLWIRKMEGYNGLKFLFQLDQQITQWSSVNFTSIAFFDLVDSYTNSSLGINQAMIKSCISEYDSNTNRFSFTIQYMEYSLEEQWMSITLRPYNADYPTFTPGPNIQFFPPSISIIFQVKANNNQNSNLYPDAQYKIYQVCLAISYFIIGTTILTITISILFWKGMVISFQMLIVVQLTYFSLAFLDSINPVFAGLLPLRYTAGILNFTDIEDYLYEYSSPNSMKGIYLFIHLSSNFKIQAISLLIIMAIGGLLYMTYHLVDYYGKNRALVSNGPQSDQWKGLLIYNAAIKIIGQLLISMILACLPLYTISLFFQLLYTQTSTNLWEYAQAFAVGVVIVVYFIVVAKLKYPKEGICSHAGEYISQFYAAPSLTTVKYINLIMVQTFIISGFAIVCIYTYSKLLCPFCIICACFIDIIAVANLRPYKYGFISWCKDQNNDSETIFQKIQLYKTYEQGTPAPTSIKFANKCEEDDSGMQVFRQHFPSRKNTINSKHQGLIQAGRVLNEPKVFLFNNNIRRVINLFTLLLVQLIVILAEIFTGSINIGYNSVNIFVLLPFCIQIILLLNFLYNFCFLVLQIMNRTKQNSNQVGNDAESSSQFAKSILPANITKKESITLEGQNMSAPPTVKQSKTSTEDFTEDITEKKCIYVFRRPEIIHPTRVRRYRRTVKKIQKEETNT